MQNTRVISRERTVSQSKNNLDKNRNSHSSFKMMAYKKINNKYRNRKKASKQLSTFTWSVHHLAISTVCYYL